MEEGGALPTPTKLHSFFSRLQPPCDGSAHCRCKAVLTIMLALTQQEHADNAELSRMVCTLGLLAEEMFLLHAPGLGHHQDQVSEFLARFEVMGSHLRPDNTSAKDAVAMTVATGRQLIPTFRGEGGHSESFDDEDISHDFCSDADDNATGSPPVREAERRADPSHPVPALAN